MDRLSTTRLLSGLLLAILCELPAGVVGRVVAAQEESDSFYKHVTVLTEVLSLVERAYVEEPDVRSMMAAALDGTMDAVDPFAVYVPTAEVEAYRSSQPHARSRSGLLVLNERGVAYVASVDEGGPAEGAGLKRGEIISKIQGEPTRKMPLWRIRRHLASPAGTRLDLEVIQEGEKRSASLELARFERPAIGWRTVREVPILRIPAFSPETPLAVEARLRELQGDRLLIDLRGTSWGDPSLGYAVAEHFASGELGALVDRERPIERFSQSAPPVWRGTLAVLVDRGTLGAAEILATVLRQAAGAELMGSYTFGHAGRTGTFTLTSGSLLELTVAFYTGPDLEPIDEGLAPDHPIRPLPAFGVSETEDPEPGVWILDQAIDLLEQMEAKKKAA